MQIRVLGLGAFLVAGLGHAAEPVRDVVSSAADREAVAVTVYNDDLALVKERRKVDLASGLNRLSLREVAMRFCHSAGPVIWALVPPESTATVTGMSTTSNS